MASTPKRATAPRRRLVSVVALGVALAAIGLATAGTGGGGLPAAAAGLDDEIRLNEMQVVGSHNSYHQIVPPAEEQYRHDLVGDLDEAFLYRHAPLAEQFASQRVRQIELDLYLDTAGGRYAEPYLRYGATGATGAYDPSMLAPGIKVLHVQDIDYASSCLSLVTCLAQVKAWSDANPTHVPMAIQLELIDDELSIGYPTAVPEDWTTAGMDALDAEIRTVFSPEDLITPDDVRGSHATLDEAVTSDGWPTLGASRGKVMFVMDNGGGYRQSYLSGHPGLQGRVLFTSSASPGQADAGVVKLNDPIADAELITRRVAAGYLVRTRADVETHEARSGDTTMRDAALASGAQWVSTDYPAAGVAYGFTTDYVVELPDGQVARCNPVNAPPTCDGVDLDAAPTTTTTTTTTTTASTTTTTTASTTTTTTASTTTLPDGTTTSTTSLPDGSTTSTTALPDGSATTTTGAPAPDPTVSPSTVPAPSEPPTTGSTPAEPVTTEPVVAPVGPPPASPPSGEVAGGGVGAAPPAVPVGGRPGYTG